MPQDFFVQNSMIARWSESFFLFRIFLLIFWIGPIEQKKIFKLKKLTFSALERQIEAQLAEHRRSLESETEKFAIKERSNNNRLSEVELELTRLNGELRLESYPWNSRVL